MNYWKSVCNAGTRPKCIREQLVPFPEYRPISAGDTIILYDYSNNDIYGPMIAITGCEEDLVPEAWQGQYQYQVKVAWDELYRITSSEFPRIENSEEFSEEEFQQVVDLLQNEGDRLMLLEWGTPAAALDTDIVAEPRDSEIASARKDLEAQLENEPPDAETTECQSVEQVARQEAFREAVREAYDETCAVCGIRRETPDGRPEVEAAHIKPKSEGGPDDIRNGIALCKLHHWAFDNSWLSVTDNYRVEITDAQCSDGYSEFVSLDGQNLELPADPRMYPAQKYFD